MAQCSSPCSSSNELAVHDAIQAAAHVQQLNIKVALQHIKSSTTAIQMLLGSNLQAELMTLRFALQSYHRACEALEMLYIATSR